MVKVQTMKTPKELLEDKIQDLVWKFEGKTGQKVKQIFVMRYSDKRIELNLPEIGITYESEILE